MGSDDGKLYALDAGTGAIVWVTDVNGIDSAPAVRDGVVFVGSDDGSVYVLDTETDAILWISDISDISGVDSAPAVD